MPWSGSGSYTLPPAYSPEVNGTTIDATRYNGLTSDVATGITAALAKNGENVPTANLPMGGFKHTGAVAGTATGQYLMYGQTGASLTGNFYGVAGSVGAPGFAFTGDTDNGWWAPAADTQAWSLAGAEKMRLNSFGLGVGVTPAVPFELVGDASSVTIRVRGRASDDIATVELYNNAGSARYGYLQSASGRVSLAVEGAGYVALMSNAAERLTVNGTGNVTINAPSSGVGLTQTGFAGSDTAIFNGGTSGSFRVTDRGLPYGTALHNNAGAITGTTNQYIASGTYTPTLTNTINLSALTAYVTHYTRVGNVVTVGIRVTATAAGAGISGLRASLPIASDFTAAEQCAGTMCNVNTPSTNGAIIIGRVADNEAEIDFTAAGAGVNTLYGTFTYLIV